MEDRFNLERFLTSQESSYAAAIAEIRRGSKTSHWMWFVFPQIDGLGSSPTARFYSISGLEEAREYLSHAVLGARLRECAQAALDVDGRSAFDIFGTPDDLKLRSSATLFAAIDTPGSLFEQILEKYFAGAPDKTTLILAGL